MQVKYSKIYLLCWSITSLAFKKKMFFPICQCCETENQLMTVILPPCGRSAELRSYCRAQVWNLNFSSLLAAQSDRDRLIGNCGLSCKMCESRILISAEPWKSISPSAWKLQPPFFTTVSSGLVEAFWMFGFGMIEAVQSVTGNTQESVQFSTAYRYPIIHNLLLCVCERVWFRVVHWTSTQ